MTFEDAIRARQQQVHAWMTQGDYAHAREGLLELLRLLPDHPMLLNNLVAACLAGEMPAEAQRWAQKAFLLAPANHTAQQHMGHLLLQQKRFVQASDYYRLATQSDPRDGESWEKLAHCLGKQGRIEACLTVLEQGLSHLPDNLELRRLLLYHLLALPRPDFGARQRQFAAWEQRLRFVSRPHQNSPDPDRRLRIGYVSADFRFSVGAQVIAPLFSEHDARNFEIIAYANQPRHDEQTAWFQARCDGWRTIRAVEDDAVAEQIRADRIDILVDLGGLMPYGRLPVFARKPAPIQLTGLGGYISGTGLPEIDYCLADRHMIPPELEGWHRERILPLSCGFHWQPRPEYLNLPLREPPSLQPGQARTVFGCGNDTLKLNQDVIQVWSRILRALPQAELLLKSAGLQEPRLQAQFCERFARHGISAQRIRFAGETPPDEHLAFYNHCDVVLDPFPFNGAISTCDALWMGAPVVTLAQGSSTIGDSILSAVGFSEGIAGNAEDYIAIACQLAQSPARLRELKQSLRPRLAASAICDAQGFCAEVETIYRQIWRDYCRN